MFHAREMGLSSHTPPEAWLQAFIQQHGTKEQILGPAAKYDDACL
jgi:hypothetical protein